MVKKKGYRPKGLIQILAAIGLVIAILWIAKGMFHFGSAGLPTLKCVPSDNSDSIIYDLAEMDTNEPKNVPEEIEARKRFFQQDGYFEIVNVTDKEYQINIHNVQNGIKKGYLATITRSSGVVDWTFPGPYRADLSFAEVLTVMQNAEKYSGICTKIENKNF